MFRPLITYMGKETGSTITFRSAKNYDAALAALVAGAMHISYMGPSLFAIASAKHAGRSTSSAPRPRMVIRPLRA